MTRTTKKLDHATDDPPWASIRRPSSRVSDPMKYLRGELGHILCRKTNFDCIEVPCPVDYSDPHMMTLCGRCSEFSINVAISCTKKHKSSEILEAIFWELD